MREAEKAAVAVLGRESAEADGLDGNGRESDDGVRLRPPPTRSAEEEEEIRKLDLIFTRAETVGRNLEDVCWERARAGVSCCWCFLASSCTRCAVLCCALLFFFFFWCFGFSYLFLLC